MSARLLKVAADSLPLLVASAVSAVLAMVYAAISARELKPAGYADVAASLSLSLFLLLPTGPIESGITTAAADAYGSGNRGFLRVIQKDAWRTVARWLAVGLLIWGPLVPFVWGWLRVRELSTLFALSLYVVAAFGICVPRAILRGDHRFGAYATNQIVESAARVAGGLALIAAGFGAFGAIMGYAIGIGTALLVAQWQLRTLPPSDEKRSDFRAKPTALPLFVLYLYCLLLMNFDVLVAKRVLAAGESGLYASANTLSRTLFLFATPVYQVLFSRVAAEHAAGRSTTILVRRVMLALAGVLGISSLIPIVFGEFVLRLLFGGEYVGALQPFRYLWFASALLALESTLAFVLVAQGRGRVLLWLVPPSAAFVALVVLTGSGASSIALATLTGTALGGVVLLLMSRGTGPTASDQRASDGERPKLAEASSSD